MKYVIEVRETKGGNKNSNEGNEEQAKSINVNKYIRNDGFELLKILWFRTFCRNLEKYLPGRWKLLYNLFMFTNKLRKTGMCMPFSHNIK